MRSFPLEAVWGLNSFLPGGLRLCFRASSAWMKLTHMMEKTWLDSKFTDLHVNHM